MWEKGKETLPTSYWAKHFCLNRLADTHAVDLDIEILVYHKMISPQSLEIADLITALVSKVNVLYQSYKKQSTQRF